MSSPDPIRVAYLIGTSHCGSTLLAFLADSHPEMASVGEAAPTIRIQRRGATGFLCSCGQVIHDCPFWQDVTQAVGRQGLRFSSREWTNDYQSWSRLARHLLGGYRDHALLRWLHGARAVVPGASRKLAYSHRVNRAWMRAVLDYTEAQVFFDTTKSLMRLRCLLDCPDLDVRVVWVVRDVRAFARSVQRKGVSARDAAERWNRFHRRAGSVLRRLPGDRVLQLKYEALCTDPAERMNQLARFLGVAPFSLPEVIDPSDHHVLGNHMRLRGPLAIRLDEKWRTGLRPGDQEAALAVAGPLNRELGYAD